MRQTTKHEKIIKSILYSTFKGTAATRFSIEKESEARKDYIHNRRDKAMLCKHSELG